MKYRGVASVFEMFRTMGLGLNSMIPTEQPHTIVKHLEKEQGHPTYAYMYTL
jgi:hypothetical protein